MGVIATTHLCPRHSGHGEIKGGINGRRNKDIRSKYTSSSN